MSTATAADTVKYSPGDVVYIEDRHYGPITLTQVISTKWPIGYAGTYIGTYNGNRVQMDLGWIPQKLIRGLA